MNNSSFIFWLDLPIVLGKNKTECLHHVDKENVANVLEVHAPSIFRVKECTVGEFL